MLCIHSQRYSWRHLADCGHTNLHTPEVQPSEDENGDAAISEWGFLPNEGSELKGYTLIWNPEHIYITLAPQTLTTDANSQFWSCEQKAGLRFARLSGF